jgi:hypothetical protein
MFMNIAQSGPRRYVQFVEAYRDALGLPRHRHGAKLGRLEQAWEKLGRWVVAPTCASSKR